MRRRQRKGTRGGGRFGTRSGSKSGFFWKPSAPASPVEVKKTAEKATTAIAGAIVVAALAGLGILGLSLGGRAYRYVAPQNFTLKEIDLQGRVVLSNDEAVGMAGVRLGQTMSEIDLGNVKEKVLSHPRVKTAVVEAHMPGRLVIKLEERVPIGLVQKEGTIMGIDAEGVIIPLIPSREQIFAPIITGAEGMTDRELLREALSVIEFLRPDLVTKISEVRLLPATGITLLTTGNPMVIRLGRESAKEKIDRLRTLLEHFEKNSIQKDYIDLRFKDIATRP